MVAKPIGRGPTSVLMYSHDGVGLGHVRRNSNIAARLVRESPDVDVLMVVGCPLGPVFDLPTGVDYVKLPSIAKVDTNTWESRKLRMNAEQACYIRSKLIQRVVELFEPSVFLVDHMPTGVWGELLPTLRLLRASPNRPRIILGLRDILDKPEIVRRTWLKEGTFGAISKYYDEVFIYGCRHIFDGATKYGLSLAVPEKIRYCGYLSSDNHVRDRDHVRQKLALGPGKFVVVTAGGGVDAFPMMSECMAALKILPADERPNVSFITGLLMNPEQRAELEKLAEGLPARVTDHVSDILSYLNAADLVVTMGGYNALVECVRLRKPTIVVPRQGPSAEQRIRAEVFSDLGLVKTVRLGDATAERLARAIRENLAAPQRLHASLGVNGLDEAVKHIRRVLEPDEREAIPMVSSISGVL